MLVHLASLALLANVKPLITHQANQFAGGLGFRSTLEFIGQRRQTDRLVILSQRSLSIFAHNNILSSWKHLLETFKEIKCYVTESEPSWLMWKKMGTNQDNTATFWRLVLSQFSIIFSAKLIFSFDPKLSWNAANVVTIKAAFKILHFIILLNKCRVWFCVHPTSQSVSQSVCQAVSQAGWLYLLSRKCPSISTSIHQEADSTWASNNWS